MKGQLDSTGVCDDFIPWNGVVGRDYSEANAFWSCVPYISYFQLIPRVTWQELQFLSTSKVVRSDCYVTAKFCRLAATVRHSKTNCARGIRTREGVFFRLWHVTPNFSVFNFFSLLAILQWHTALDQSARTIHVSHDSHLRIFPFFVLFFSHFLQGTFAIPREKVIFYWKKN